MKIEEISVDLDELKTWKEQNAKERMDFIKFWADYVRTHSDKDWSEQQNFLIDSQINGAMSVKNKLVG